MAYTAVPHVFAARTTPIPLAELDHDLRYVSDKVVSVRDFGAVGDGVADDSPPLQEAIDHLFAQGGGTLVLPPGRFKVTRTLYFRDNVAIVGAGRGTTTVVLGDAAGLGGAHGIFEPMSAAGAKFGDALPPEGYFCRNNRFASFSIDGNRLANPGQAYEGIAAVAVQHFVAYDVEAYNCGEVGLQGQVTNVGSSQASLISFVNCVAHSNNADGFQVGGASLVGCIAYSNGGAGIDSVGNFVSGNVEDVVTTIDGCRADQNGSGGITAVLQAGPPIRTMISNSSAHRNTGNGIVAAMDYTTIASCEAAFNSEDGMVLQGDHCTILGGKSYDNGTSSEGPQNFRAGIKIAGARRFCAVRGVTSTDDREVKTQQLAVAFTVAGGGSDNLMDGNVFTGNAVAAPYQIGLADGWRITNNVGFNPTGPFGSGANPANPVLPASGVPLRNTYGYPVMVTVVGAGVSDVAIDGTSTGVTGGVFTIGPGQTIALTYGAAPSWKWWGL